MRLNSQLKTRYKRPLRLRRKDRLSPHTAEKKAPGSGRRRIRGDIERIEVLHELDEAARACPWCASERPVIGEERSEEVELIPAKVVVKVHVRRKYGPCTCDDFIGHDEPAVVTAPAPAKIAKGSQYANSTAAFIIVSKYVDGLSLYRQEAAFERMGLELGRGTMARMILRVSEELEPLWQRMKEDLRSSPVLGMDETVTQVLHEPERPATSQSRMWVARGFKVAPGSTDPPRPIIWFEYADSRFGGCGGIYHRELLGVPTDRRVQRLHPHWPAAGDRSCGMLGPYQAGVLSPGEWRGAQLHRRRDGTPFSCAFA